MTTPNRRAWIEYASRTMVKSPLYSTLYASMQQDQEMLALLDAVREDQPPPVTFFMVVNYLVFSHLEHPFALSYPYLCKQRPYPLSEAYSHFKDFCQVHHEELQALLPDAILQTNEVARCSNLLPAFNVVSSLENRRPLAFIELGASAGLNLLWPHYEYHYRNEQTCFSLGSSPVKLDCKLRGSHSPQFFSEIPPIASCSGIELKPLDYNTDEGRRWLKAAIWPEELDRYQHLDAAITLARKIPPMLFTGDASELLPELLTSIPTDQTVCLWHSYALNQGPASVRECIEQQIIAASDSRSIYRISLESNPAKSGELSALELSTYKSGALQHQEILAHCSVHGEYMEWM